jgi:hypothetical protein
MKYSEIADYLKLKESRLRMIVKKFRDNVFTFPKKKKQES